MDEDDSVFEDVTSRAALSGAIERLLQNAHDNGVDVEGSFEIRNGPTYPDWEAQVHELAKQDSD